MLKKLCCKWVQKYGNHRNHLVRFICKSKILTSKLPEDLASSTGTWSATALRRSARRRWGCPGHSPRYKSIKKSSLLYCAYALLSHKTLQLSSLLFCAHDQLSLSLSFSHLCGEGRADSGGATRNILIAARLGHHSEGVVPNTRITPVFF